MHQLTFPPREQQVRLTFLRVAAVVMILLALSSCQSERDLTLAGNSNQSGQPPVNRSPQRPPVLPLPPAPESCPKIGDTLTDTAEIYPELLVGESVLEEWQTYMVDLGPRYTGSENLRQFHDFLADQLAGAGQVVQRLHKHPSLTHL